MLGRVVLGERAIGIARFVAVALTLVMAYYFLTSDAIRSGNPFLVPDALLTVLLLAAALTPRRWAAPVMIFAFAWSAAVWTVSLSSYAVRGEFADGANHFALIIPACVMAGLLAFAVRDRAAVAVWYGSRTPRSG